jgi:5'-nucleotidase
MDYTLVHYRPEPGRRRPTPGSGAADRRRLAGSELQFDPSSVIRGLVIDNELGNIVKANRFGYVIRAAHGTRCWLRGAARGLPPHPGRPLRVAVLLPQHPVLPLRAASTPSSSTSTTPGLPRVHGYEDLFRRVRESLDEAHIEGTLKAEIMADPEPFIDLDPGGRWRFWTRCTPANG